jgi:lipopolysaccharide/colanic/teichoic acid biosynthesis glycosyltransferase
VSTLSQGNRQTGVKATRKKTLYRAFGKRLLDLALTVPALILLSPLFALTALFVRLKLGSPIFFQQKRPGLHGRTFAILKFRTMTNALDDEGNLLHDAARLTPFGKMLRRTSLDELPELINVLRGEMSLVGPRPLLMRYLPYYTPLERRRFEMLPGITGWAQVNGRNNASWDERLAYDAWYAERCSLALDLRILALTLLRVLRRENVQVDPHQAMLDLDEERSRNA